VIGKTHAPEVGQWHFTETPLHGATRNPWNTDHTPGGSSGGAAAAVAAGVVAVAIGSDGAGSIRIPAAWTGLVGLKPQRGRVSTWPDPEAFNGLGCYGPLARSVSDAALLLDAIRGNVPADLHKPQPPAEPFAAAAARTPASARRSAACRCASPAPPRIGALEGKGYWATSTTASATCPFAFAWNVVGWPAISVPAGLTSMGLPIGPQLLGRESDEATLLSLAGSIERAEGGWPYSLSR
jgi:Asp-tRNA(Asn)/Glu-tRNA(Gln) amidotransferase A subunit family amidase